MRLRAGTLEVALTADGSGFQSELKQADAVSEAFATNVSSRMKRARAGFEKLGEAVGATAGEWAVLESEMREGIALDSAGRQLANVAKLTNMSREEFDRYCATLGMVTKEARALETKLQDTWAAFANTARQSGMMDKELAGLEERFRRGMSGSAAAKALTDVAKGADMSRKEVESYGRQMGLSGKVIEEVTDKLFGAKSAFHGLEGMLGPLGLTVAGTAIAFNQLRESFLGVAATKMEFEAFDRTLQTVTGSQTGAAMAFESVGQIANDLGIRLGDAASGYKTIAAAAKGSVLEGAAAKSTFEAVAMASSVLGLSADDTGGILNALGQMISKGKVQSEELRGQLGERLPGAFQIAARSMGLTTAELDKLLSSGGLATDDFLPRFTEELKKTFEQGAAAAGNSTQAAFNRMETAWDQLKAALGDTSAFHAIIAAMGKTAEAANAMAASVREATGTLRGAAKVTSLEQRLTMLQGPEAVYAYGGPENYDAAKAKAEIEKVTKELAAARQDVEDTAREQAGKARQNTIRKQYDEEQAAIKAGEKATLDAWANSADRKTALWATQEKAVSEAYQKAYKGEITHGAMEALIGEANAKYDDGLDKLEAKANKGALAAERYGERAAAYLEQVQNAIAGINDSLTGGMESDVLKVDKAYEKIFSDIRQMSFGAKGDTEALTQSWMAAYESWPVAHMTAQLKDFGKEIDHAAKYARDMGTYLSDPQQLQAADWLEGYKQYLEDLREARYATDQEDAAGVARAQSRWDAYQQHVLQAERDRLGEGGKLSEAYWQSEAAALQNHLAAVREIAGDETAVKIYEAEQWDAFLKAQLEEQAKYAGSFGETLAAKWSLAFGGYESETTRAKKRWGEMSDAMVEGTEGVVEAFSGGIGDVLRMAGDGAVDVENIANTLKARLLDILASFLERAAKMALESGFASLFGGEGGDSGGLSLSGLAGSKSSGGSLGDGIDAIKTLGDYVGKSSGNAIGDYLTTAASSGNTLFLGGGNALSDIFAEGIDVSSLGKFSSDYFSVGAEAVASTYSAAETAAMAGTSVLGTIGSVLGVVGAIGGVVGLLSGLFGEQKKEIKKTASGYNVQYAGGKTVTSGVDFYSDGSVVGTGVGDPDVTRQISEAFKEAAENLSDFADVLGFTAEVLDGFRLPGMNITDDQVGDYIRNGTNAMAFQALEQAGLRGAFDQLAEDGEVYIDQIERLATAYSTGAGKLSAYGYEMGQVAQVTQEQIEALRTQTIETAAGTSDAIMAMAQSMGATSAQLAELAANASDGSQALAVTDEQLSNLLEADWMSQVLDNVGGEDAFNAIMDTLLSNVFDSVEAYAENLGYYGSKASTAIAKLGDASITVDNFWDKFNAALKAGLDPDQFELWAKASTWVNSIDSVTKALADWNDAMVQASQSLDVRLLKARGLDYEAELTQLAADAEWALADAREAGYDAAVIARMQLVQEAERLALIAKHAADYADKLRDANKRYAEAVGDSSALVEIAIEENALQLAELAKTFNWSPGSSEEGLFQATQRAQWAEIIKMIQETADALAASTRAMRTDLDARKAAIAGYDEEAEAIQMVAGYADQLSGAIKDGLDEDLIAELMQVQIDELAKYWADALEGMRSDLADLYRQQSDLLDSLSGNTKTAIEELYGLFARYQAGERSLADDIIDSLKSIGSAINAMVQDVYATIYEIRTGDSYTTDDSATVAANSKAYFEEQYARAASGDTEAMGNVTSYAKDYLTSLRSSTADQSVYQSGVDYVTSMLSQLGTSGSAIGGNLTGIGTTVTNGQIAAAQEALHRAEVAQLRSQSDAYLSQAMASLQGSDIGNYLAAFATTGLGWQGVAHLLDTNTPDGAQNWLATIRAGNSSIQDIIGWFVQYYGTGTGYVDWAQAVPYVSNLGIMPANVIPLYSAYQQANNSWQTLKSQYGFATGGLIEGGIPGEDSVFVLGKPGESVLTERQTDMLLLLADRIQGVMLGGAGPAASGRDDLAAEVAELRREVVRQGDRLRQTQERLVDNTQDIVTILARCGGKEGSLMVVAS